MYAGARVSCRVVHNLKIQLEIIDVIFRVRVLIFSSNLKFSFLCTMHPLHPIIHERLGNFFILQEHFDHGFATFTDRL
jgi:hypothetical protein